MATPENDKPQPAFFDLKALKNDIVMIEARRSYSREDVRRENEIIQARRRMSDKEIRENMHSPANVDMELRKSHREETKEPFVPATGFTTAEADALLAKWGKNELEEKSKPKWKILLEQFTAPMPCMIWVAIIVEGVLENWPDFGILCALQFINGGLGFYETTKADNAVAALKASLKPVAHVKRDGKFISLDARLLVPGDLVLLGSGGAVPADCIINHGQIDVDQSALTGESLPVTMHAGDNPKMGSTVTRGEVEATVADTGMRTFFGKTASLIQSVDGLGHLQKVLLNIMFVLLALSIVLCAITLAYLLTHGEPTKEAISFTVVLLVASIPIAMEVVVTTTMALGSRQLAAMNAIVSRLAAIEELAGMNMLCSDKTGTLTLNKMVIQEDCPMFCEGITRNDVILHAALAAKWWEPAKDALDTMVLGVANLEECTPYKQLEYTPFDPTLKRTEATLQAPDGSVFKVTKGAPHIVLHLCHDQARIQEAVDYKVLELAERGIRSLAVARTNADGQWYMMGIMTFLDPPRPDTKRTIERAMEHGVDVKMITGDHQVIAKETARQLGMGTNILLCEGLPPLGPNGEIPKDLGEKFGATILGSNGFAQVFPEHKFLIVEALRQQGFNVGMTGDGVNDAPALKKADIGIAVQGATDAARASADIILTSPGLSIVVDAIVVSRCIFARMKSFIIYRVACTLQLLIFFFISVLGIRPRDFDSPDETFPSFWSMPVIALIMITLLNDGTIISIAYDNVKSSRHPEVWNLPVVYTISSTLGGIACIGSLIMLLLALKSHEHNSLFSQWGLPSMEYGQIITLMYLKVSLSDFLTLFCARCQTWFWTQRPGKLLMCAFVIAIGASTGLAIGWPFGEKGVGCNWHTAIFCWIYCLVWFIIQDAGKVLMYKFLYKYNILGISNATSVLEGYDHNHFGDSQHPKKLDGSDHPKHGLLSSLSKHLPIKHKEAPAPAAVQTSEAEKANGIV